MAAATLFGFDFSTTISPGDQSPHATNSTFGSPNSSYEAEDGYLFDEVDEDGVSKRSSTVDGDDKTGSSSNGGNGNNKKRGRRPPSTAAKRATHNAIERARRESLNGRFLELARALPNMNGVKRPSKSAIVIKSLEYVYEVQSRERSLAAQNVAMKKELEDLRSKLGLLSPPNALPPHPHMSQVQEMYGLGLPNDYYYPQQPHFVGAQQPGQQEEVFTSTADWTNVFGSYVLA